MTPLFFVIALLLMTLGGLLTAIEAAYQSLSRQEISTAFASTPRAARFERIAADIPTHLNAVNFTRILCESGAAISIAIAVALTGMDSFGVLISATVATALLSFVLIGSSPRSVGRANPFFIVRWTASLVRLLRFVFGSLANLLVGFGEMVTPARARTAIHSERQLLSMVDEATESEAIEEEDRDLIRGIFDLGDTILREVMIARTEMVSVGKQMPLDEALECFIEEGFSRMPVVGDGNDDVQGIVNLKDIVMAIRSDKKGNKTVGDISRPATFLPEVKKADEALRLMQSESQHLALVVDEYGGIAGLVTLEDLIEKVIGDITDEHDDDEVEIVELPGGAIRVTATTSIDDLAEALEIEIDEQGVDTVGGLFVKLFGRFPATSDMVTTGELMLVAERVEKRRGLVSIVASRVRAE
jgi:CBS domain containing-hemolysin-like protein